MKDLTNIQVLLFNWIKHYGIRNREQIRIATKRLCVSNHIESKHSLLRFFYPMLKNGLVEFVGNDLYQVSPPLMLFFPKQKIAVGVNLSDEQKQIFSELSCQEDNWGIIRFSAKEQEVLQFSKQLNCEYQRFESDILSQFPKIKDVVSLFEDSHLTENNIQYYDTLIHKWQKTSKGTGLCRTSSESMIFYLKLNGKYKRIPNNSINPDGRLLAESFQACIERDHIFTYNSQKKELIVNNLNLPILIERFLRLCSLYEHNAVKIFNDWQVMFPHIETSMVKQINRIFGIKTKIING